MKDLQLERNTRVRGVARKRLAGRQEERRRNHAWAAAWHCPRTIHPEDYASPEPAPAAAAASDRTPDPSEPRPLVSLEELTHFPALTPG